MAHIVPIQSNNLNESTPMVSGVAATWDIDTYPVAYSASVQFNTTQRSAAPFTSQLSLQVSNDEENYVTPSGYTLFMTNDTSRLIQVPDPVTKFARVAYTPISGSGILEIYPDIKTIE